ncbi:polysaccharide pyruvyl transferase CsaB [Bacillus sp. PS06]|uniref:polysaccharide pyruvyl transferase CsaB n=1 Tax=Bacillus sp. PS06 TaxID=2764176 RepID=UPI00177DFEE7|nr:polysaccharide pyruvyl transferase CsaB [Bacillus sp. PS06]MBD8067459.1 polysaccharide pyruvyl transferase CsaB [Bacillus sp. PS06]
MEVVISGYYGFDNVGDEAILLSIIEVLRNEFPFISITVLSNQPQKTSEQYGVKAVNRWSFKEVMKAIKKSDGVISGGGGLLQDKTGILSVSYYCGVMWFAHLLKKPFFVYAQGIGPIKYRFNKQLVANTLKKAALITVRDDISKQFIEQIGVTNDIYVVPDPVIGLNVEKMISSNWLMNNLDDSDFIVVTVRYWKKGTHYLERIASGLDSAMKNNHHKIVFIPMHGYEDYLCSLEVKSKMSKEVQHNIYIVPPDLSIQEKASIIGSSQLLIGMRLHSLIFAAIKLIPFISISYDQKIDVFTEVCGQKNIGNVETLSWDSSALTKEIDDCISSNGLLKENISLYIGEARKNTDFTAIKVFKQLLIQRVYGSLTN